MGEKEENGKNTYKKEVYQRLGATHEFWLSPKCWLTPMGNIKFSYTFGGFSVPANVKKNLQNFD